MAHITTCTRCGKLYEDSNEESANATERLCVPCFQELRADFKRIDVPFCSPFLLQQTYQDFMNRGRT